MHFPKKDTSDSSRMRAGYWVKNSENYLDKTFEVEDPATGMLIADVADTGPQQWREALDCASDAAPRLSNTTLRERADVLSEIYRQIIDFKDELAELITYEMGKPLAEARQEVDYGAEYFHWFAGEASRIGGRTSVSPSGNGTILTTKHPVGPVLAITPWNFPFSMISRKIAPALAAGCPVITKPAAETPLTLLYLVKLTSRVLADYGMPKGVISALPTLDAAGLSQFFMGDSRVAKVTFTGSTAVGKILVKQSAQHLQRTSMELGGNAPFLVAADANLDLAVECAVQAKLRNGGQACIAVNRFIVQESLVEEFESRLVERLKDVKWGNGFDVGVTLGPIITSKQRERIAQLVDEAVAEGARLSVGGFVPDGKGYFYPATLLADVSARSRIFNEEIFGPVVTLTRFSDLSEGIALANSTPFGLAAYGFTESLATSQRLARELQAGMVGINKSGISDPAAPFGGIKESGFGREGGLEGIEDYLELKYVALP
ncbi:NAD-dependent succinate-semialdehyde dehydrogenase [Corynebacterium sp. ED61]|nr:NAD-dependent succinate-semialdehyde dehydrogenase [Corynebacterium sp. ED61]